MKEYFYPLTPTQIVGPLAGRVILLSARQVAVVQDADGAIRLPRAGKDPVPNYAEHLVIGRFGEQLCVALESTGGWDRMLDFRLALHRLPELERLALARALTLQSWRKRHRYCGSCGAALRDSTEEIARICPDCAALHFPVLSPAVIVAIRRKEELLLAHNAKFAEGLYSLIAGFVEAGETLEEAVQREVREEVGLEVENIRYFGSQSWPFPNSLMLGFTADYAGGEVRPDGVEITDAAFFSVDRFPAVPDFGSISRTLIEDFRKKASCVP